MQLTRKQIIEYLNTKHTATATGLSQALNVTAANIRHHISELIRQDILEEVGNLPTQGRGRPTKLYCLSKGALNHNLDYLADILLKVIAQGELEDNSQNPFTKIAHQMLKNLDIPTSPIKRLTQAMEWLNDHNYQSRWEASPKGPRVVLGYCPYVAILDTNPEMCQIDTSLLSQLVGLSMEQIAKLERAPQGIRHCVFAIRKNP
jgi:predicted ArsR family transcriptional regulator